MKFKLFFVVIHYGLVNVLIFKINFYLVIVVFVIQFSKYNYCFEALPSQTVPNYNNITLWQCQQLFFIFFKKQILPEI